MNPNPIPLFNKDDLSPGLRLEVGGADKEFAVFLNGCALDSTDTSKMKFEDLK